MILPNCTQNFCHSAIKNGHFKRAGQSERESMRVVTSI